mgnify:CR=1 FL=1
MDEPTRVFVLRHGQTAWNASRRIQGHVDEPLDDIGRWQAQRLGQALAGEGIAAIYSSDLRRAHDTALALAATTGLPVVTQAKLRERAFGRFEGATHAEIEQRWPEEAARWPALLRLLGRHVMPRAQPWLRPGHVRAASRHFLPLGRRVCVIGSDLPALELADFVAHRGRRLSTPGRYRIHRQLLP